MSVILPSFADTNMRKVIFAVHQLAQGRTNSNGMFTLTANATSTVVPFVTAAEQEFVMYWQPTTPDAAAQMATMYCTGVVQGSFVIHHSSNPSTDQTFNFEMRG